MVEIPNEIARDMAAYYRRILDRAAAPTADPLPQEHWAEMLDPTPIKPTLREACSAAVVDRFPDMVSEVGARAVVATVLPVVLDAIERLPEYRGGGGTYFSHERIHRHADIVELFTPGASKSAMWAAGQP